MGSTAHAEYRLSLDRDPWTVDRGPQMQNAKPTTRFFFLLTAYCLLPTGNCPATAAYTGGHPLEKRPKTAHFFSLFRPPGVLPTCRRLDPQALSCQADRT